MSDGKLEQLSKRIDKLDHEICAVQVKIMDAAGNAYREELELELDRLIVEQEELEREYYKRRGYGGDERD